MNNKSSISIGFLFLGFALVSLIVGFAMNQALYGVLAIIAVIVGGYLIGSSGSKYMCNHECCAECSCEPEDEEGTDTITEESEDTTEMLNFEENEEA